MGVYSFVVVCVQLERSLNLTEPLKDRWAIIVFSTFPSIETRSIWLPEVGSRNHQGYHPPPAQMNQISIKSVGAVLSFMWKELYIFSTFLTVTYWPGET